MKIGMVLEGGGMRGIYSAGILDVMMENGIKADGLVGVSAGAAFGCNFKSEQIGRALRYNKKYCNDPRYGSIKSFIKTGDIFDRDFCYHQIPLELDPFDTKTFQDNPMEFYATCTDVKTGEAVYHKCFTADEEDLEWFRASASMPLVSKLVEIGDGVYLDGGIADSIPIHFMTEQGYQKNIVILTRHEGYRKEKNKLLWLMRMVYRKYPEFVRAVQNRHINYNASLDEIYRLRDEGKVILFCPDEEGEISRTENKPENLELIYQMGRKHALGRLSELKAFTESR